MNLGGLSNHFCDDVNNEVLKLSERRNKFLKYLESLPTNSVFIFTDGCSLGNPGPCGAGAIFQHKRGESLWCSYKYLGPRGTNNIGEIYAFNLACDLVHQRLVDPKQKIYIFSDSQYSIDVLEGRSCASANKDLIGWVKVRLENVKIQYMVEVVKVPAHCFIGGNEMADDLAKRGARCATSSSIDLKSATPIGHEICFPSKGRLDTIHLDSYSLFLQDKDSRVKKGIKRNKLLLKNCIQKIRKWEPSCLPLLLGFPTVGNRFSLPLSKIITGVVGEFFYNLETQIKYTESKYLRSNEFLLDGIVGIRNMKGVSALVLWDKTYFTDNLDRYLYGICSGMSENPLGFYFKWMGYSKDESLDKTLHMDSKWTIIWLPHKLSNSKLDELFIKRFLPGITPPLN